MKINPDKCVACGYCTYVCPMGAIYVDPRSKRATLDRDECVECYACFYGLSKERLNPTFVRTVRKLLQLARLRFDPEPDICPTSAFEAEELQWPRVVRRAFSDPLQIGSLQTASSLACIFSGPLQLRVHTTAEVVKKTCVRRCMAKSLSHSLSI